MAEHNREMRDLELLLSKLNPMAEEFVPHSLHRSYDDGFYLDGFCLQDGGANEGFERRKKNAGRNKGCRGMNSRTSQAQREDVIRRTVYVSDIDHQVTEEQLATLFISCGQVVDCRVCGDPKSVLRFAFIEFTDEGDFGIYLPFLICNCNQLFILYSVILFLSLFDLTSEGARAALSLAGTMLGFYPVKVRPSKTAIAPVNPTFLPKSDNEREMCARTVYCTDIDKKVSQAELKLFFESLCGKVHRMRLLNDFHHPTRIAFVEFVMADSATAALNCNGVILGSSPIRVSPSKTPVRPPRRQPMY